MKRSVKSTRPLATSMRPIDSAGPAVAGSVAGSKWMSEDLLARAASTDKALHVVEGANHMDLYDGKPYVAEAVSVLTPFFQSRLKVSAAARQAAE